MNITSIASDFLSSSGWLCCTPCLPSHQQNPPVSQTSAYFLIILILSFSISLISFRTTSSLPLFFTQIAISLLYVILSFPQLLNTRFWRTKLVSHCLLHLHTDILGPFPLETRFTCKLSCWKACKSSLLVWENLSLWIMKIKGWKRPKPSYMYNQ